MQSSFSSYYGKKMFRFIISKSCRCNQMIVADIAVVGYRVQDCLIQFKRNRITYVSLQTKEKESDYSPHTNYF